VLEAELEYERLLRKQELLKREKEHKKELQSVREEMETEKQKLPNGQEVQLSHANMYPIYSSYLHGYFNPLINDVQEQMIENDSQSLETLSLQAFSNVSTWHIAACLHVLANKSHLKLFHLISCRESGMPSALTHMSML